MIKFNNWTISVCGAPIATQYDNLSRSLNVVGEMPDGWDWAMLVESGGNLNIISLSPVDGGVGVTLTDDMLSLFGYYTMQLRGTQGEVVRHTNVIQTYIPASLSGDAKWPTVPSEFTQVEQNIISINNNPPKPGVNGYWMIYNPETGEYEESDIPLPAKPKSVSVTLSASGWASNSQTVPVQGVETSGQSVRISPATKTDADNWVAAGVWCSEPTTANQLVFTCDTAPTENININVELQEVQS